LTETTDGGMMCPFGRDVGGPMLVMAFLAEELEKSAKSHSLLCKSFTLKPPRVQVLTTPFPHTYLEWHPPLATLTRVTRNPLINTPRLLNL
jgi:hypothetical protein